MSNNYTIFVGGPIQYALAGMRFDPSLRDLLKRTMGLFESQGIEVLNAHQEGYFDNQVVDVSSVDATIRDFESVKRCSHYVCVMPKGNDGRPYRSDGCNVELGWASALGRKVVLVGDRSAKYSQLIEGLSGICNMTLVDITEFEADENVLLRALD